MKELNAVVLEKMEFQHQETSMEFALFGIPSKYSYFRSEFGFLTPAKLGERREPMWRN